MDNIQLYYIDNEINKIDKMKQGDVIYKNGVELLVVLSYDHNEPCKGCFFYEDKACGSERLIKCWDCKKEYIFTAIRKYNTTELSQCVEDISRFAAGDIDLQHTTDTLINDMDGAETLGIRSFIINNSRAIRRKLFPDLGDYEHIGYDGGSKDKINRKRLIGNTYQIYRSILHQLAIDEDWNNVYSDITLPSGDMGTIKVERIDDDKDNDI